MISNKYYSCMYLYVHTCSKELSYKQFVLPVATRLRFIFLGSLVITTKIK